jgi:hypothetical protein
MTARQEWRRSSHSGAQNDCVELRGTLNALRDSKDVDGPALAGNVPALVRAIKSGRFDR